MTSKPIVWLCAAIALPLLLAACAGGDRPGGKGPGVSRRYVAMGSSFAAGSGLGPVKTGTPQRCGRSYYNYPTLLAERLRYTLIDMTCGGATTENILRPWDELPAQLDAVTPDTRLVTVTIGGNDLNYVRNLIADVCKSRGSFTYQGKEVPCMDAAPPPTEEDYWRLEENLRAIAREIKHRAPHAKLVFVQYLTLVPKRLCDATPLSPEAAAAARKVAKRLAEITKRVALDTDAEVLAANKLSERHNTPCDEQPWSTGFPADLDPARGIPWHPNRAGHAAIASKLAQMLRW